MKRKILYLFIIALIFSCSQKSVDLNKLIFSDILKFDTSARNEIIENLTTNKKHPYRKEEAEKIADMIIRKRKKIMSNSIFFSQIILNMI